MYRGILVPRESDRSDERQSARASPSDTKPELLGHGRRTTTWSWDITKLLGRDQVRRYVF